MKEQELIFSKKGAVAEIMFNRPTRHNAVTFDMYQALEQACDDIDADKNIRVTVISGVGGKAFVAGTDISQFTKFSSGSDAIAYETRIDTVVARLEKLKCPSVAVLQGVCAGGGVPLALACDFRLADENLRFGVPIAKTLGNCLSMANVSRLIDFVGVTKTKELLMLGRWVKSQEALDLGLVNGVYTSDALDSEKNNLIQELLKLAPLTLRSSKVAVRRILQERRVNPEFGEDYIQQCYTSEDFHNAVEAFLAKKPYTWLGR